MEVKHQPLISVIIPCYNYAHYLAECFRSLQQQSYSNWECLLVDNASTDNTKQVVEEFAKQDTRIKYLYQPIKGPSASRNLGIKEAKGDYIQFLDSDDLFKYNKFQKAIALFEKHPDVDIVYSGARYFKDGNLNDLYFSMAANRNNDRDWMCYAEGGKAQLLPELLKENIMVISSPVIKKSALDAIGYFDESLAYNEDWELWLRFAFADKKFLVDRAEDSFALIRVHTASHSRNPFKMFLAGLIIGLRYQEKIEDRSLKSRFRKKTLLAQHVLEKLLYEGLNDKMFFTRSLQDLIDVCSQNKYLNWQNLYSTNRLFVLRLSIKFSLLWSYLKYKF